jgi:ABC-type thiamine transport system ATPase subunit
MNLGYPENVVKGKVEKAMKQMGIIDLKDKPTHFLSYGQKKSVPIADIIVMEPEIIIWMSQQYIYTINSHKTYMLQMQHHQKDENRLMTKYTFAAGESRSRLSGALSPFTRQTTVIWCTTECCSLIWEARRVEYP